MESHALTEEDKQYFLDANAKAQDGWNAGDREAYVIRYAANAIYMPPHKETMTGLDGIRGYLKTFPDIRVKFSTVEMTGSNEQAYVRGTFVITSSEGAVLDKGKFLSIWNQSEDKKWQITHDIFNSDLPVSAAPQEGVVTE
jgi:ketosteroid isomerase-like protein